MIWDVDMTRSPTSDADLDMNRARPALVWNYLSGEKDYFQVDQKLAEEMTGFLPDLPMMARANRRFVFLTVWHLMTELGIRQFAELGAGMPRSVNLNLHEIAQDIDPSARVLYLDDDPIVAAHYRALVSDTGTQAGRVEFLSADAADPGAILNNPVATDTLDLSQPVALMLVSVLEQFPHAVAHHIVTTLLAGLPPGSYLVASHLTADFNPDAVTKVAAAAKRGGITSTPRTRRQVTRFFTGLDLLEPGVVPLLSWKPGDGKSGAVKVAMGNQATRVHYWVGIGRRRPIAPSGVSLDPLSAR
jgi:hypothetical protein